MQVVTLRYRCWKWINQIARIYRVLFFFFSKFTFQILLDHRYLFLLLHLFFSFSSLITKNEIIRRKFKKGINNTNRTFSSIVYFNRYIYIYLFSQSAIDFASSTLYISVEACLSSWNYVACYGTDPRFISTLTTHT